MNRPATAASRLAARLIDAAPVLILAAIAGAGSFVHIRDTAVQHGQRGPMSWAIAICIDLTCVMAARERQRDIRTGRRARILSWPVIVLTGGVLLSLAANLDQAQPDTWGRITAATPAAAFLIAVSMIERRAASRPTTTTPSPAVPNPGRPLRPRPSAGRQARPGAGPRITRPGRAAAPLRRQSRRRTPGRHRPAHHPRRATRPPRRLQPARLRTPPTHPHHPLKGTTMTTPDKFPNPVPRDQIIGGLRQLADYLDTHPAIPVAPYGWELLVGTHCTSDPDGVADIDAIAANLGVTAQGDIADGDHYAAIRTFGPITYRAFHIPAACRAVHKAFTTYANSVTPDDGDPDDPPQAA